jgi:hypothetical protein
MADPKKSPGSDDLTMTALRWAGAVAAVAVVAIPAVVGFVVWRFGTRRLRRVEQLLIVTGGVTVIALDWARTGASYLTWLVNIPAAGVAGSLGTLPVIALAASTMVVAGLLGLAAGTKLEGAVLTKIGREPKRDLLATSDNEILPTAEEISRVDAVAAQGKPLVVSTTQHSMTTPAEIGKRTFPVALDRNGQPVVISEDEIRMHGLLFGSTGSGKSEAIKAIAGGLLDLGWSGIVLDLKEDTGGSTSLRAWCETYAQSHLMPYQQMYSSEERPRHWFNPLEGMTLDEARDAIVGMAKFNDPYYEARNKKQLGQLLTLMYAAHEVDPVKFPGTNLRDIGVILSSNDLKAAVKERAAVVLKSNIGFEASDFQTVLAPNKDDQDLAAGLGARITAAYESEVGRRLLRAPGPGDPRPNLDVTAKGLTYIGLDSTSKIDLTSVIGTATLSRIAAWASARISGRNPQDRKDQRFIIIDEANFINRKLTLALLSRVRGAGLAIILCTQGPLDWRPRGDEPGMEELLQNTNVTLIMSQGDRTAAEICADIIGRTRRIESSQTVRDGELTEGGTLRSTVDYRVDPDQLRQLGIGQMVMRIGKPAERVVWGKVVMRDPRVKASRPESL